MSVEPLIITDVNTLERCLSARFEEVSAMCTNLGEHHKH